MSALTEYAAMFTIDGRINESFNNSLAQAQSKSKYMLKSVGDELKKLNSAKLDLNKFQESQNKINNFKKSLSAARDEYKLISKALKQDPGNKVLQANLKASGKKVNDIISDFRNEKKTAEQLGNALKNAGLDTSNLGKAQNDLARQINNAESSQAKLLRQQEKLLSGGTFAQNFNKAVMKAMPYVTEAANKAFDFTRDAVMTGMNFDKQVSHVNSVLGLDKNSEEAQSLRKQAREQGASTKYSAEEVSKSQENLARAGLSLEEVKMVTPLTLKLAATEDMSLDAASGGLADTKGMFNLKTEKDFSSMVDMLAQTSRSANTNILQVLGALKYAGAPSSKAQMSREDTLTFLTDIINNTSIKGEEAGNALKGVMLRLVDEGKDVKAQLAKYGIGLTDREGNLLKLEVLMQKLQPMVEKMGSAEKLKFFQDLGGQRSSVAMMGIYDAVKNGEHEINNLKIKSAYDNQVAQDMVNKAEDNLAGDLQKLNSAFQDVQISVSDQVTPALRDFAQSLTGALSGISALMTLPSTAQIMANNNYTPTADEAAQLAKIRAEKERAAAPRRMEKLVNEAQTLNKAWNIDPITGLPRFATGGIFNRPQIGLFAEDGPEAILPLNDPRRSFEILGESGLLNNINNNTSQGVKNFNIAPVINVSGDNNNNLRYEIFEIVKQAMQDIQNESERLAYA